jgi:acetyl-CoA acyltransferase
VLARTAVKGCLAEVHRVKPEMIDDLIFGCSFPEAEQGLNMGRVIAKHAGLPDEVPGFVINRFCSSGLQAIALAAQNIMCGWNDIIVAGLHQPARPGMDRRVPGRLHVHGRHRRERSQTL